MAKISLIAAIGKNRELGKGNALLWQIPADLNHFRKTTENHPVIMGERTFDSIGRVLPNRLNIVLTQGDRQIDGCRMAHSINDAIKLAGSSDEIFFIGGGSVYAQAIEFADKLYLTLIDKAYNADVYFPEYNQFKMTRGDDWQMSNDIKFKFTEWEKS